MFVSAAYSLLENAGFNFALKGCGFSRTVKPAESMRLYRLLKNSMLVLLLGSAAVYRCDKRPILSAGFSRCGGDAACNRLLNLRANMWTIVRNFA